MRIYKKVDLYDRYTGKLLGKETHLVALRCDYSGRVIGNHYIDDNLSYCTYVCDYGSQDQCFGSSGEEFAFGDEFDIYMHEFMSQPYTYYDSKEHDDNEEITMIKEIARRKKDFPTLESAFREFRIRAARKLIMGGEVTAEELKPE